MIFVATKVCLSLAKRLSRQTYFCRLLLSRQTRFFVFSPHTKRLLSRQAYFCGDKRRVLWRQKRVFVATKIILVAAPVNDTQALSTKIVFSGRKKRDRQQKKKEAKKKTDMKELMYINLRIQS